MEILTIKNLTKKYDKVEVLRNINMHVTEGEIYGLIGKNGAGKTTLMKAILGLTDIAGGEIKLWGKTISNMPSLYNRIGANLDFQGFYPELSAYENLKVFSNIRGVTKKYAIEEALEKVDLFNEKDKKYKRFSLGMKKRLGLANAIIHEPEFIILDEPTNGLDPIGISQFREYLMKISKEQETTIMISSHLLSEIDIMADRIGVLNEGVLIAEKSIEEIRQGNRTHIKILVTNGELTCGILEKIFHVEDYEVVDKNTIYIYNLKLNREEFSKELAKYGVGINVNLKEFPEEMQDKATSLILEGGHEYDRNQVIAQVMKYFEINYEKFIQTCDFTHLLDDYHRILANLNQPVRVIDGDRSFEGICRGIDEKGELLVERQNKEVVKVSAGEVSVRGLYSYV